MIRDNISFPANPHEDWEEEEVFSFHGLVATMCFAPAMIRVVAEAEKRRIYKLIMMDLLIR